MLRSKWITRAWKGPIIRRQQTTGTSSVRTGPAGRSGATNSTSQAFVDLVQAVIDRQKAGIDVKIIMSEFETTGYLEQLQAIGLNVVDNVKIQNNVHNKGMIVDGQTVLVSSQNWSTDGTLYNRDAGVIIHHPETPPCTSNNFSCTTGHTSPSNNPQTTDPLGNHTGRTASRSHRT